MLLLLDSSCAQANLCKLKMLTDDHDVQRLLQLSNEDLNGIVDSKLDADLILDAIQELRRRDVSLALENRTGWWDEVESCRDEVESCRDDCHSLRKQQQAFWPPNLVLSQPY